MALPHVAWPDAEELSRLVEAAQHEDARAIETLLATLRPPLLAFFARNLPLASAEDLAQLALVRVVGALSRIMPQSANRYVATVARNLLRTAYRHRARDAKRTLPMELADTIPSPASVETQLDYQALALAVHRASVEVLPPALRTVVLGLLDGQTPAEIAASLRVSPVTVRTRLLRARAVLRRELRPLLDHPTTEGARKTERKSVRHPAVSET